jgi:RNA polymerase sigma factor (sigma-70 family)
VKKKPTRKSFVENERVGAMCRWLMSRLRGERREDAEDLIQEALVIRYSKDRAVAYESAYVEKVIKNLRSNVERNHERAVTVSLDEVVDFLHSESERDPLVLAVAAERDKELNSAIRRLPDSLRRVVELRLQGMADKDIASRVGVTPDGVRTYLVRARGRLLKMLLEAGHGKN